MLETWVVDSGPRILGYYLPPDHECCVGKRKMTYDELCHLNFSKEAIMQHLHRKHNMLLPGNKKCYAVENVNSLLGSPARRGS